MDVIALKAYTLRENAWINRSQSVDVENDRRRQEEEVYELLTSNEIAASILNPNTNPDWRAASGEAPVPRGAFQAMRENRSSYKRLDSDATSVITLLYGAARLAPDPDKWVTPELRKIISEFVNAVQDIRRFVRKQLEKNPIMRLMSIKTDVVRIADYRQRLQIAVRLFQLQSRVKIHEALVGLIATGERLEKEEERKKVEEKEKLSRSRAELRTLKVERERWHEMDRAWLRKEFRKLRREHVPQETSESGNEIKSEDEAAPRIRRRRESEKKKRARERIQKEALEDSEGSDDGDEWVEEEEEEEEKRDSEPESERFFATRNEKARGEAPKKKCEEPYDGDEEEETCTVVPTSTRPRPAKYASPKKPKPKTYQGHEPLASTSTYHPPTPKSTSSRAESKRTKTGGDDGDDGDDFNGMNMGHAGSPHPHFRYWSGPPPGLQCHSCRAGYPLPHPCPPYPPYPIHMPVVVSVGNGNYSNNHASNANNRGSRARPKKRT